MINGSSKADGNTGLALREAETVLKNEGIDVEVVNLGGEPIRDCIGCGQCSKLGKCVFNDDIVNKIAEKAKDSDGFVFGTPVYYAHPSGRILCALDRLFYSNGKYFTQKPGFSLAVARRGGTTASVDVLNKYFTIAQMPVASSSYWTVLHGAAPGEVLKDAEGLQTVRHAASNLVWLLKSAQAAKKDGILPPENKKAEKTNFIR